MKLFFETGNQAAFFLSALPPGFMLALGLFCGKGSGMLRLMADIVLMVGAGLGILLITTVSGENSLRFYHLLGMLSGMILYLSGFGRIFARIRMILLSMKEKRSSRQELSTEKTK